MRSRSILIAVAVAVLSISLVACSSGGGSTNNAPAASGPVPTPTSLGTTTGTATSAVIGAGGGTVSTPDSRITVSIPAGALSSNTTITIQPITNTAHGGLGIGYRLLPEGKTFLKPVALAFTYTDADLEGTAPEALGIAVQTADGYWELQDLVTTLSTTAKTLTATATHFSRWSLISQLRIAPASTTLKVNEGTTFRVEMSFEVRGTRDPKTFDRPVLGYTWSPLGTSVAATIMDRNDWAVNTVAGGNSTYGTIVNGSFEQAGYLAPAAKPVPNTVVVSAKIKDLLHNNAKYPLTARVTIIENRSYAGDFQFSNVMGVSGTAHTTWTQFEDMGDVRRYLGSGTIDGTINYPNCDSLPFTVQISSGTAASPTSVLIVYTATNAAYPKQHTLVVVGDGPDVTLTCGSPPNQSTVTFAVKNLVWAYAGNCGAPPYTAFTDENLLTGSDGACNQMLSTSWTFTAQ